MKPGINLLLLLAIVCSTYSAGAQERWRSLFDGKSLKGWKANVHPESFSVVDGVIRARSVKDRSHLFYVGEKTDGFERFKNFELEAMARGEPGSNSGIFFHTDFAVRDQLNHLANGYEVQRNRIIVRINGQVVVDYTEPEQLVRPPERAGRRLNPAGGAIALQAHDPDSTFYFKDIRIRPLP